MSTSPLFAYSDTDAAAKLMYSQDVPQLQHLQEALLALTDDRQTFNDIVSSLQEVRGAWILMHSLFYRPLVMGQNITTVQRPLHAQCVPLFQLVVGTYWNHLSHQVNGSHEEGQPLPSLLGWLMDNRPHDFLTHNIAIRSQSIDYVLQSLHRLSDATPKLHARVLFRFVLHVWSNNWFSDNMIVNAFLPYIFGAARHMLRVCASPQCALEIVAPATPVQRKERVCPPTPRANRDWDISPDMDAEMNEVARTLVFL